LRRRRARVDWSRSELWTEAISPKPDEPVHIELTCFVVHLELEPVLEQIEEHRSQHRHRVEDHVGADLRIDVEAFVYRPRRRAGDLIRLRAKRDLEHPHRRLIARHNAAWSESQPADAWGIGSVRLD